MKNISHRLFYFAALCLAASLTACGGGDQGPAGSTGATGPAGDSLKWVQVLTPTQQMADNTGYIADDNSTAGVLLTLPSNPVLGSVVKVSGKGSGGWRITPNAGQAVLMPPDTLAWKSMGPTTTTPTLWRGLASSVDGLKLVAAGTNGQIYTSADAGLTWTLRTSALNLVSLASSDDGVHLVGAVMGGQIYTSADSGVTWVARDTNQAWVDVASSSDGSHLVAVAQNGQIYTSIDFGVTWTARETARQWQAVASSADGSHLVSVVSGGQIYTSIDSGVTWLARATTLWWIDVASSSDGSHLAAVAQSTGGQIYTSIDFGVTWTARDSVRNWRNIASSADGNHLVAVEAYGVYRSTDAGVNWMPIGVKLPLGPTFLGVALSADGSKVLVGGGGELYHGEPTKNDIYGLQYAAAELQHLGGGKWVLLNYSGGVYRTD